MFDFAIACVGCCRYYCCCLGLFLLSFLLCSSLNMGERFEQLHTRYIRIRIICVFCLFVTLVCCCFNHYYCRSVAVVVFCFCCLNNSLYFRCLSFHTRTHTHSENRSIAFPVTLCEGKVWVLPPKNQWNVVKKRYVKNRILILHATFSNNAFPSWTHAFFLFFFCNLLHKFQNILKK